MDMKKQTPNAEFLVIGAGLSRTGTLSLMIALEILLPGKCFHGFKASYHEKEWCDIICGKMSDEEFKNFFYSNNYVAAVDAPFYMVYDRALRLFPKDKVVLSVRDPESWVKSTENTIRSIYTYSPISLFLPLFPDYLSGYGDNDALRSWSLKLCTTVTSHSKRMQEMHNSFQRGDGVRYFNKWIEEVESTVPKEKLLKFNVKDGWGPLCKHLRVPVPNVPFPKLNSTKDFGENMYKNKRRSWLLLYEFITIPLWVYWLYNLSR